MATISVIFYKGPGNWADKAIRLWTRGPYSHCEIVLNHKRIGSDPKTMIIRELDNYTLNSDKWDILTFEVNSSIANYLYTLARMEYGKGYDWKNIIFSDILPFDLENKEKWTCDEFCAYLLIAGKIIPGDKHANWYNPNKLYNKLIATGEFL